MAYVITAKYADGLPSYRLSEILKRHRIEMSRQTLSESVLAVAGKIKPLIDHMKQQLQSGSLIHIDETQVQVLKEPGKPPQSRSYMWVQRGGPPDTPVIHFHYDPSRSADVAGKLLDGFTSTVMSDGYEPYRKVAADNSGIVHLCCLAHARRKLVEAKMLSLKVKAVVLIRHLLSLASCMRWRRAAETHHQKSGMKVDKLIVHRYSTSSNNGSVIRSRK